MRCRKIHIVILLLFCGLLWSQDDGVVSFSLPVRNSLTFNKFLLSPTFSFVREADKTLSFTNKRQWTQFDNAPENYIFSYSGRLNDNSGFGVGLFQENYGVLSTYGGVLNYVYNVPISSEHNLSFGGNAALYQSGLNTGKVITTFPDPSLDNVPSNFLMTINPSVNYGTRFIDFGLTLTNFTLYNFSTSSLIEDDPEQSIDAHFMYTGYMTSRGFFDDSKFSTSIKSEFRQSDVVLSGLVMLTVPKGIWGQAGYNTLNGFSAGIGLNLFKGLMLEYNYERAMGNLSVLGSAHEISIGYRFTNRNSYKYTDDAEMASIIPEKRTRKTITKTDDATRARIAARAEARRLAKLQESENEAQVVAANTNGTEAEKKATESNSAEEEAMAEAKARELAQEEAERLERIKASEELRKKEAEEALAAAMAEEKRKEEEAKALAARKAAEERRKQEEAKALAAKEAAEEEARLLAQKAAEEDAQRAAQLQKEEEQRRMAAAEALAAAEAEERRKQEEAKALAAKQAAEEEARLLAQKAAEEEARRAAQLQKEEEQRRIAAAEAEERRKEEEAKALAEQQAAEEAARQLALQEAEEAKRLAQLKAAEEQRRQAALAAIAAAEAEEQKKKEEDAKAQEGLNDPYAQPIKDLTEETSALKEQQDALLQDLKNTVEERKQDLADLKEENDLSEQGIYKAPKPFKSISEQNARLEELSTNLDQVIEQQGERLNELQKLYDKRKKKYSSDDEMSMIYLDEIVILQNAQKRAKETKQALLLELSKIKTATEIERKRRIKRAAYDNQEDRYAKDMADLKRIKETTDLGTVNATEQSFDFGDSKGGTIKILQNVKHTENGYYLVMAVHSDKVKRDEFLKAAIESGAKDINFFYDVNTSKYYIYKDKFKNLNDANRAIDSSGSSGYDQSLSMIKIENK
jgi:type IX secretion system PorP/SprF family membrane protein